MNNEIIFGFTDNTQFMITKDYGENTRSFDLAIHTSFDEVRLFVTLTDISTGYVMTSKIKNVGEFKSDDIELEYDCPDFGLIRVSVYELDYRHWAC
nr:hypothetical protein [Lachnospiraceae bacterium]